MNILSLDWFSNLPAFLPAERSTRALPIEQYIKIFVTINKKTAGKLVSLHLLSSR